MMAESDEPACPEQPDFDGLGTMSSRSSAMLSERYCLEQITHGHLGGVGQAELLKFWPGPLPERSPEVALGAGHRVRASATGSQCWVLALPAANLGPGQHHRGASPASDRELGSASARGCTASPAVASPHMDAGVIPLDWTVLPTQGRCTRYQELSH